MKTVQVHLVIWATLVFSKEEILKFQICNFENDKSLGRKVHFFNFLGTTKIFQMSVYTDVVLLMNFP